MKSYGRDRICACRVRDLLRSSLLLLVSSLPQPSYGATVQCICFFVCTSCTRALPIQRFKMRSGIYAYMMHFFNQITWRVILWLFTDHGDRRLFQRVGGQRTHSVAVNHSNPHALTVYISRKHRCQHTAFPNPPTTTLIWSEIGNSGSSPCHM